MTERATGWLVERNDLGAPRWLCFGPKHRDTTYTTDTKKALRFARKEDAEAAMLHLENNDPALRVTEHIWTDESPAALLLAELDALKLDLANARPGDVMENEPAEVFCLAEFLCDELIARDWTTAHAAVSGGGTNEQIAMNQFKLDLLLCVQEEKLLIDDDTFAFLARAFDVSEQFFRNLDAAWRKSPQRRVPFQAPESVFPDKEHSLYTMPDDPTPGSPP